MLKIKIKSLSDNAKMPFKAYKKDFCYDCVATSITDLGNGYYEYGLGFSLQFSRDFQYKDITDMFDISIDIRPRSSIWKTGMIFTNSVGTGDDGYTGEYKVVMYHIDNTKPKYEIGDKVCQIKVGMTPKVEFIAVSELSPTDRGANGYGSTGK